MLSFPNPEEVVMFDIDDTLILWGKSGKLDASFIDPDSGAQESGKKHIEHIKRLIEHKEAGHTVIAWSGGGGAYARAAIDGLGLTKYVDLCMSKPMQYYDDYDAHAFMGRRSYIGNGGVNPVDGYLPIMNMVCDYSDKD